MIKEDFVTPAKRVWGDDPTFYNHQLAKEQMGMLLLLSDWSDTKSQPLDKALSTVFSNLKS